MTRVQRLELMCRNAGNVDWTAHARPKSLSFHLSSVASTTSAGKPPMGMEWLIMGAPLHSSILSKEQ